MLNLFQHPTRKVANLQASDCLVWPILSKWDADMHRHDRFFISFEHSRFQTIAIFE
jgi:hypothetical protein